MFCVGKVLRSKVGNLEVFGAPPGEKKKREKRQRHSSTYGVTGVLDGISIGGAE